MMRRRMPSKSICTTGPSPPARVSLPSFFAGLSCAAGPSAAAACRRGTARTPGRESRILVGFRHQRRRLALLEDGEVQAERLFLLVRRHVEPLRRESEIRGREEPQVLAARIPGRPDGIRQAIGQLLRLTRLDIRHEDGVVQRLQPTRVRHPLRIGAPHGIQRALRHHPFIAADHLGLPARDIEHPHVDVRVRVEQLLRVRRPRRGVVVRRLRQRDLARRAEAVRLFEHQPVLAGLVAEIRNVLAVRRPRRIPLRRPARLREVPDVALLHRDREDLAARFHHGAPAGRRNRHVAQAAGDVLPRRHHPGKVAGRGDRQLLRPAG